MLPPANSAYYREHARAKLNLFLHITGKRDDFYHLLNSLVVFTEFGDVLEVEIASELSLTIAGPFAENITDDNIILKAAKAMQDYAGMQLGAKFTLHKNIPVGAGLGGGSSDAAAAMRALCKLWQLDISTAELQKIGLTLGADVPVCIAQKPALMRGIGEQLIDVDMADAPWLLLVNPNAPLATKDVFGKYSGAYKQNIALDNVLEKVFGLENDLQIPAIEIMPEISNILAALSGTKDCAFARMSGSGATCFGVYDNEQDAQAAFEKIQKQWPQWWLCVTKIYLREKI